MQSKAYLSPSEFICVTGSYDSEEICFCLNLSRQVQRKVWEL